MRSILKNFFTKCFVISRTNSLVDRIIIIKNLKELNLNPYSYTFSFNFIILNGFTRISAVLTLVAHLNYLNSF